VDSLKLKKLKTHVQSNGCPHLMIRMNVLICLLFSLLIMEFTCAITFTPVIAFFTFFFIVCFLIFFTTTYRLMKQLQ
jgi:hypothetical protein